MPEFLPSDLITLELPIPRFAIGLLKLQIVQQLLNESYDQGGYESVIVYKDHSAHWYVRLVPPLQLQHRPQAAHILGLSIHPLQPLKRSFKITFRVDETVVDSVFLKKGDKLDDNYLLSKPCDLHAGSILTVRVQEEHLFRSDKTLALLNLSPEKIFLGQGPGAPDGKLKKYQIHLKDSKKEIWLNFNVPLSLSGDKSKMSQVSGNATSASDEAKDPLKVSIGTAMDKLEQFKTLLSRMGAVEHFLDAGLDFAEVLKQLNSAVGFVVGCLKLTYQKVKDQDAGHGKLLALASSMHTTVAHIGTVKEIAELEQLRETLDKFPGIMEGTLDLIDHLVGQGQFVGFVLSPSNNKKINDLNDRYAVFKENFDRGRDTEVAERVHSLTRTRDMEELDGYLRKGNETVKPQAEPCLPGTRAGLLDDVASKANDLDGANVIWVKGAPGSGKSSISLSAKSTLQSRGRLVKYFRFDRSEAAKTTPSALWCHVAYELADRYPSVRKQVLPLLRDKKLDQESETIDLFTQLVYDPLLALSEPLPDHPLVIVIDALDECGGRGSNSSLYRDALRETLKLWPKLPRCFKLLVTSREEDDMIEVLSSNSAIVHIPSGHSPDDVTQDASRAASKDIRTFLEFRFNIIRGKVKALPSDWPGTKAVDSLVDDAAGNFMWATAVAKFISDGPPNQRLQKVMDRATSAGGVPGMNSLYSLYSTILETSFASFVGDSSDERVLRVVLAIIVFAQQPILDLQEMKFPITLAIGNPTQVEIAKETLEFIRNGLSSVVNQGQGPLRFIHKSFDDFLLSDACLPEYRIRESESHLILTKLCLVTMKAELRFNICSLETSGVKNTDLPEIESKVKVGIPRLLSYSCQFWADHLVRTPFDDKLMLEVKGVLQDKLLYWFEAMSLLKEMNRVSRALLSVLDWLKFSSDDFKDFVRDGHQFIGAFINPITQSAAHIYISALPFSPEHSLISRRFLPRFPRLFSLAVGKQSNWSSCIFTSEHHKAGVNSVTFSPDEKFFITGSNDETVHICDSDTGNLVTGPFRGSSLVVDAFLSPDGRRVWAKCFNTQVIGWDIETGEKHLSLLGGDGFNTFGSCCFDGGPNVVSVSQKQKPVIALWSAETGERLKELFEVPAGSLSHIHRLLFSPDGVYMAWSGVHDTTIRICRLVEGGEVKSRNESHGHTQPISALSFSVDGLYVVTGAEDGTILIWDVKTAEPVDRPLAIGKDKVNAVAYSHHNRLVVASAGNLGKLMVWNASTQEIILGPLEGHTSRVNEITFSRDGRRALSASYDGTVKMWDLGQNEPLRASHAATSSTSKVVCVAFSPCGIRLASVGWDMILRVWDITTGEESFHSTAMVTDIGGNPWDVKIIFTPDGSQIAAYHGCILRIWNADTGELSLCQSSTGGFEDIASTIKPPHLAFRSTDNRLVMCSRFGLTRTWCLEKDAATEDANISSPQPEDPNSLVNVLALSPDGLTIFVDDVKRTPRHYLWSTTTCQPLPLAIAFPDDKVMAVAFLSNGNLATASSGILQVWNIHTEELAESLVLDHSIWCLEISSDNRHIAYSTNTSVQIWNASTGHLTKPWNAHVAFIRALAFSPDGKRFASGSEDGQIRIWDTTDLVEGSEPSVGFLEMHMQDGWIMDNEDELLFWVPKDNRGGLVWPRNVVVIGGDGIHTELDLTKFRYGKNWTECYEAGEM